MLCALRGKQCTCGSRAQDSLTIYNSNIACIYRAKLFNQPTPLLMVYVCMARQLSDPFYVPACNIGGFDCGKVLTSSYAHILSHWGLVPRGHILDLSLAGSGFEHATTHFQVRITVAVPAPLVCSFVYLIIHQGFCYTALFSCIRFFHAFPVDITFCLRHPYALFASPCTFCMCSSLCWARCARYACVSTSSISPCLSPACANGSGLKRHRSRHTNYSFINYLLAVHN